jgi:hypothetical protein
MIAYKLFRVKANGAITSLFINKTRELPIGEWLSSDSYPTKGFAVRPGWHCTAKPEAPHLSLKGRVWAKVEIEDFCRIERPASQGGTWYLAKRMKIINLK